MEEADRLFVEILRVLDKHRILQELVLIGGWCQRLYRNVYGNPIEISALRTVDIDFLVPKQGKEINETDISSILKTLDFDEIFSTPHGYNKYVHPDMEIEFLVPWHVWAKDKPVHLKNLHTNAQGLPYLDLLENHTQEINYFGLVVTVPKIEAFVINKLISSQKRNKTEKSEKDLRTAIEFGEYILKNKHQKILLRKIFAGLNIKLQRKLLNILEMRSKDIHGCLTES